MNEAIVKADPLKQLLGSTALLSPCHLRNRTKGDTVLDDASDNSPLGHLTSQNLWSIISVQRQRDHRSETWSQCR